jgi:hypothetical protein
VWYGLPHRREQKTNQIVCSVRFQLDDDERADLSEQTDEEITADALELARIDAGNYSLLGPSAFPDRPRLPVIDAVSDGLDTARRT